MRKTVRTSRNCECHPLFVGQCTPASSVGNSTMVYRSDRLSLDVFSRTSWRYFDCARGSCAYQRMIIDVPGKKSLVDAAGSLLESNLS